MQKQPRGTGITGTTGLLSCCAALRPAAGGGLLLVDVCAVLLHEPVQLLLGTAGDLVLYVIAYHGGNSFLLVKPRFGDAVLRLRPVVGRVRTARCDGARFVLMRAIWA